MIDDLIDYFRIARAQLFYSAVGYKNVDVPWLVSIQAIMATLPPEARPFQTLAGCLVASGEQSFIEFMIRNKMEPGRYQCTTPCFCDEQEYNELTRVSFFKTELIWYQPEDPRAALEAVMNHALSCFFEISDVETFEAVQTPEGMDIYFNGIELGSYGIRKMGEDHLWVYGTGLAEPRFSIGMKRQHQVAALSMSSLAQAERPTILAAPDTSIASDAQAQP